MYKNLKKDLTKKLFLRKFHYLICDFSRKKLMKTKKRDFVLSFENLETRKVCSVDPLASNQWGLDAIKTNNITAASSSVVVAIVDSGVDVNHQDLKNNIWNNPFEKLDGIDNDNNGYIDDINGWNFVGQNNDVKDDFYHGTHVAGIIAAEKNGIDIEGVNPSAKIMSLKFQNSNGVGYTGAAVSAINYAVKMKNAGVNIGAINLSWGGGTSVNLSLQKSIQSASDNNIMVVIAAGNNGDNNDVTPRYPSSYKFNNTISVGAINKDFSYAGYSNYGKNSVELAAPGSQILSTLPGNKYGYVSGSSMSAAFVSGSVSLLKSLNYSVSQIKNALLYSGSLLSGLADKVGFGLLNVEGTLSYLKKNSVGGGSNIINTSPAPDTLIPPVITSDVKYNIDVLSSKRISGWVKDNLNLNKRFNVEVLVNDKDLYVRKANMTRSDVGGRFGFNIKFDGSKFVKGVNKITVRFVDPVNSKVITVERFLVV